MPSRIMCSADDQVSGGVSQRVEHRIVCRADRAAQVGLRGPSPIKPRQAAGGCYQGLCFHVFSCLTFGWKNRMHQNSVGQ